MLEKRLAEVIRTIPDFPKPGIQFKDITPVFADPELSNQVTEAFYDYWKAYGIEGVVGIESRGFIYGLSLAQRLGVPFVPVRKVGKLPYKTVRHAYDLEYGSAEIEIHMDAIRSSQRILIHDDLLATGGTAQAAAELIRKCQGEVAGFSFMVELSFLSGARRLKPYQSNIHSLVTF